MSETFGARAIGRRAVFKSIQNEARNLIEDRGFDGASIDDIVSAAGVSVRTFYRYFDSKEEVALSWLDDPAPVLRARLLSRPLDEHIWVSLRRAMDVFTEVSGEQLREIHLAAKLARESVSFARGLTVRWALWEELFADAIAEHLGLKPESDARPKFYAALSIAALRSAAWQSEDFHSNLRYDLDTVFNLMAGQYVTAASDFARSTALGTEE